jgi:hypothetical protein
MREDLFRPQVLQVRKERWLGNVRLPLTRMGAAMSALALAALLATAALLLFGQHQRSERIQGRLQAPAPGAAPGAWRIELWVPERSLAFVAAGAEVSLRYPALASATHGPQRARVLAAAQPMSPQDSLAHGGGGQPLWRVNAATVDAFPDPAALRPGLHVEARLRLGREPLYRSLFGPVAAARTGAAP